MAVAFEAGGVFFPDHVQATDVHVVAEVGEFDFAGEGVGFEGADVVEVGGLFFVVGEEGDGFDNGWRDAEGFDVGEGVVGVFDYVVEEGGHAFFVGVHLAHEVEGVEDVGTAVFVGVAGVGFEGKGDDFFQQVHDVPHNWFLLLRDYNCFEWSMRLSKEGKVAGR